jgi:hypothetical protein
MPRRTLAPLLLFAACATPAPTPTPPPSPWDRVAFLTGCWRSDDGRQVSEEIWTPPHGTTNGGTMYGQNRSLRAGKLGFFELLTIERRGDDLVYVARPSGRGATEFTLTDSGPGYVVFANPAHDFPKRICYRLENDDLRATIDDGTDGGKQQTFHWRVVR